MLAENYLLILFLRQDFQGNNCSLLASRPCFVDRDRIWRQSTTLRKKEREHSRGDRESKQILQQTGEKGRKKNMRGQFISVDRKLLILYFFLAALILSIQPSLPHPVFCFLVPKHLRLFLNDDDVIVITFCG